jgi:hypothetical protein
MREIRSTSTFTRLARETTSRYQNNNEEKTMLEDNSVKRQSSKSVNQAKRDQFIRARVTLKEKQFWKLFFLEIDKRTFVKATFCRGGFGVYMHNRNHLSNKAGEYSLMYTRDGSFNMNDKRYKGPAWNGLNRLRHWCTTPGLPEQFYSGLTSHKLLTSPDHIDISKLLEQSVPDKVLRGLFVCIDLFQ